MEACLRYGRLGSRKLTLERLQWGLQPGCENQSFCQRLEVLPAEKGSPPPIGAQLSLSFGFKIFNLIPEIYFADWYLFLGIGGTGKSYKDQTNVENESDLCIHAFLRKHLSFAGIERLND